MSLKSALFSAIMASVGMAGLVTPGSMALAQTSTLSRAVAVADNRQPAIPRPEQDAAAAAKLAELAARTGRKPNILIFVVDDMGFGDPGSYGGGEAIGAATPNMDWLAAEGLRLTSTYSQQTCTPTRSAIFTGRLPVRTGLTRPILAGDKITVNPWEGEASVAGLLSDAGYHSALVGKWHIGEVPGMRPFEVGFDEFYGFYSAQKEISQEFDQRRYPDLVLDPEKLAAYHAMGSEIDLMAGNKGDTEAEVVIKTEGLEDIAEADLRLRDYTVKRIAELAAGDKPFFLTHAFMKVHTDNFPSKEFTGPARRSTRTRTRWSRWTRSSATWWPRLKPRGCWTTPSSSSPRTTARRWICGRTRATPRSAGPRARPGKVACGCRALPTGRA